MKKTSRSSFVFKLKVFVRMFCLLLPIVLSFPMSVEASVRSMDAESSNSVENIDAENSMSAGDVDVSESFDFSQLDEELDQLFPEKRVRFEDVFNRIVEGDTQYLGKMIADYIRQQVSYVFASCRKNLIAMVALALIGAVLGKFSSIFNNDQIADVSFYIVYLMIFALSLSSFQVMAEWIESGVGELSGFMSAFCPAFFVSLTVAKGSVTAVAFNNLTLFILLLTEKVILEILLPLIRIFFITRMLNYLMPEEYLSRLSELIRMIAEWMMKTILAVIIGLNAIQCLISPAIDTVKRSALTRGAESIPGVGNAIGGAAEVAMGTAMLVKNGIGLAGALVSVLICLAPIVQIGVIVLMYKLAVAIIQPVCDKRTAGCVDSVSEGGVLLMRTVFVSGVLFLLTIVMVSASAGEL